MAGAIMDNGSVDFDYRLIKELAEVLGYKYDPYQEAKYLRMAIELLRGLNGRSLRREDRSRF